MDEPYSEYTLRKTRFGWEATIVARPGRRWLSPTGGPYYWRPTKRWAMQRACRKIDQLNARQGLTERHQR